MGHGQITREEKLSQFHRQMHENLRKPISPIESMPIHFYTDGIEALQGGLKMRHIIAMKNWAGDEQFTFIDIFQQVFPEKDWQTEQGEQEEREQLEEKKRK